MKAAAETSLQASTSRATSSRATSVDIMDYERAETPQRPSHSSHDQPDPDSPFLDQNVKVEDREAILGKEASDAIGKILQNDRKNRKEQMLVKTESFSVWDDHTMVCIIPGVCPLLLEYLNDTLLRSRKKRFLICVLRMVHHL